MGEYKMKKSIFAYLVVVFLPLVIAFSVPAQNSTAADDLLVRGYKAYNAGDWKTALAAYRKAVKIPEYSTEDTWFMLIVSELYAAEYAPVVQDAEHFLTLFPKSTYISYVRYHLGRAYFLLGNYVNAVYHLTEFCHAYPNHELYASALFWIAESFFARENYDSAEALYERIVTGYPLDQKQDAAQVRLWIIREIKRARKQSSEAPPAVAAPVPVEPVLTEQQQLIATLMALNSELDAEKQPILARRQILKELLSRHSSSSATQWTPAQQRFITDMMTRNSGIGTRKRVSPDPDEKLISDLLARSAELSNRPQRPASDEIQRFITDLQDADTTLSDKERQLEGQQRLIVELIASSMGLSSGSNQVVQTTRAATVTQNLSTLESQFSEVQQADSEALSNEYAALLQKARSLWSYIVEQNQY
jgi:tetratricopeptide (TPR) repeat protein